MTFLLPAPRSVVVHIAQELVWRFREMLGALLMRRSGPRHRLRSPRQIRWQRWKVELAVRLDESLGPGVSPYRLKHPRGNGFSLRPTPWSALHPPPRTAQSPAVAEHDDDCSTDPGTSAAAYAMPNTGPGREVGFGPDFEPGFEPGFGAHGPLSAEPGGWSEASAAPLTEPWAESWAEPETGARAEPWTGRAEAGFAGHVENPDFERPRVAQFFTPREYVDRAARSAHVDPVVEFAATWAATGDPATAGCAAEWSAEETTSFDPVTDWPAAVEPGHADTASTDTTSTGTAPVDTAPAEPEPEEEWEFQVGDLARWWDEAIARLDAVARGEGRDRLW
ncbi:hypothetical protein FHX81_4604 [Saccharothrix saharensis]|uniref:Uncharacterized protein n=1 Tax=Saccharothrix saharensis TaxID=571190 RepID=A0A543JHB6_9PSEU|nr:hypothetical protein [Saccharothrix saharensis]TQM82206.1 hypothetical protein FHX81_4604 [Saccharothrix saharensis]